MQLVKCWSVLAVALVLTMGTAAAAVIELGEVLANVGDSVEITVSIDREDSQPVTAVLYISYDPDVLIPDLNAFEILARDAQGDLVTGSDGAILSLYSPVVATADLEARDKAVEVEFHPEGIAAVAIVGLNPSQQGVIPEGELFTLGFRLADDAPFGTEIDVIGHDADNPAYLGDDTLVSSLQDIETSIALDMTDGLVAIGCSSPAAPQNVAASQGATNGITVTWDPVDVSGVEYRVYRGETDDPLDALPLDDGWLTATSYRDLTVSPKKPTPNGCQGSIVKADRYWVRARSGGGCQSPFSAVAHGWRAFSSSTKAAAMAGGVAPFLMGMVLLGIARRRKRR